MSSAPILIVVTRTVRPGKEKAFEHALHIFVQDSLQTPGQMGVQIIRPAPGSDSREYGILRRFATQADKEIFYRSNLFSQWERQVIDLCQGPGQMETVTGLEAWFTLTGVKSAIPTPHWKMALTILVAVYPVTLFYPWLLQPAVKHLPGWLAHLVIAVCVVATLTWLAMPLLNRLLKPWLHPESRRVATPASHSAKPL